MGGGAGGGGSGRGGGSRRGGSNFGSEALSALARRRGKVVEFGGQQGKRGSGGSSSGTGGFHQLAERDCQGARRGGRVGGGPRGRVGRAQVKGQVLMQFHAAEIWRKKKKKKRGQRGGEKKNREGEMVGQERIKTEQEHRAGYKGKDKNKKRVGRKKKK